MLAPLLQFGLAGLAIVVAGTFLTRAADTIARRTGWGRLLVGGVFLAGATSLPELSVDLSAIRLGLPDLAVGDLFGSCLFNLLILAVLDLSHRSRRRMFSHAAAAHALSATMTMTLYALAGIGLLLGPRLSGIEPAGIGLGSGAVAVAYLLGLRLVFYDQRSALASVAEKSSEGKDTLVKAVGLYLVAGASIFLAAPFLSSAAGDLAVASGLGTTFIGTAAVAFCTSLPEIVTSYAAVRLGAFDLALGNIFGSNAFNMLLLLPLDLAQTGPLLSMVSPLHIFTCLAAILVTAVAVMGQLYHMERRRVIVEPDALLIIVLVTGALSALYWLR